MPNSTWSDAYALALGEYADLLAQMREVKSKIQRHMIDLSTARTGARQDLAHVMAMRRLLAREHAEQLRQDLMRRGLKKEAAAISAIIPNYIISALGGAAGQLLQHRAQERATEELSRAYGSYIDAVRRAYASPSQFSQTALMNWLYAGFLW